MRKKSELFKAINRDIENSKIRHVQVLMRIYQNQMALKFVNLDNENYKRKVNEITSRYCESLYLVDETKTTQTYLF